MYGPCWREDGNDEGNQQFAAEVEVSIMYAYEISNHVSRLRLWWVRGNGEPKIQCIAHPCRSPFRYQVFIGFIYLVAVILYTGLLL